MRKKNDIFDRLAQSAQARSRVVYVEDVVREMWDRLTGRDPNRERVGAPGTLERFADDLRMPIDLLIEQFNRAGVTGLASGDLVGKAAKDQLLAYLRQSHSGELAQSHILYQNPKPARSQIEAVQDANEELIRALANNPSLMYGLNPRK